MESPFAMLDNLKFDKETAVARFNRSRGVMRLRQIVEVALAFAAVFCAPAIAKSTGACLSAYVFNHHAAFLIGNSIIVLIFMLCRLTDGGARDSYDLHVKYSEAVRALPPPPPPLEGGEAAPPAEFGDRQIGAVRAEEADASSQCDDVAAAIEKASRQIRKFQRIRSEMMRREVSVRPELRRSETENRRKTKSLEGAEIENLSNEEFKRTIDAAIDKLRRSFQSQLREY